jgi:hypothetical protein
MKGYSGFIHKINHYPAENLFDYLMAVNGGDPVEAMRSPPWTESFFYYDAACQLIFDVGRARPVCIFNYLNYEPDPDYADMMDQGGGQAGFFIEDLIPEVEVVLGSEILLRVDNKRGKELPYGIFLWESTYPGVTERLAPQEGSDASPGVKLVPGQGVFVRFNAVPGPQEIRL